MIRVSRYLFFSSAPLARPLAVPLARMDSTGGWQQEATRVRTARTTSSDVWAAHERERIVCLGSTTPDETSTRGETTMRCTTASRTLWFIPVGVPIALGHTPSARRESAPRKGCVRSELVVHQTMRAHNRIALRLCVAAAVSVAALGCRNTAEPTLGASGSWAGEVSGISFAFASTPLAKPCTIPLAGDPCVGGEPQPSRGDGTFVNANAGLSFPVTVYAIVADTPLPRYVELRFGRDDPAPAGGSALPTQWGVYALFAGNMTDQDTMTGRLTTWTFSGSVAQAPFAPFGFDTASITFHRVR
jgi:hypothetical protein